jgi:hypothetical protein
VVVAAVALAVVQPGVAVFAVVLVLNQLLGVRDHVPFSRYGMFSKPSFRAMAVVLYDEDGTPRKATDFSVVSSGPTKRWRTALLDAGRERQPGSPVRDRAAADVVAWLSARRPARGPAARSATNVVLYEYRYEDGELVRHRTDLGVIDAP